MDGFLTTRLEALIDAFATVAEVNRALEDASAAIVSMNAIFPVVTLVVPAMADAGEAAALAADLEATTAFALVTPSFVPWDEPLPTPRVERTGYEGADALIADHLAPLRVPAAQNAQDLSLATTGYLPVLVPDRYATLATHPLISAQEMFPGPGSDEELAASGNRGYAACGLIGADYSPGLTGLHPTASEDLVIRSTQLGGLTWLERVGRVADLFPEADNFVLNTGFNYGWSFTGRSRVWRTIDALWWRFVADQDASRFVHVSSAGDLAQYGGQAAEVSWSSPFAVSESFPDLLAQLSGTEVSQLEDALFVTGTQLAPLGNLRTVGSSDAGDLERSYFSTPGADLRVIGANVQALCMMFGAGCDGESMITSSTEVACAQVAGLFSYLWSLAPARSVNELLDLVDRAWFGGWTPGLVDAYYATLGLDYSLFDARVRMEILDVADDLDVADEFGNGVLDHRDLKVFLDAFEAGGPARYDLNGDGIVGGEGKALFDLDVNVPPSISTIAQMVEGAEHVYDEAAVTDLDILCYYAYSSLYLGNIEARTVLMAECNGVPQATIFVDSVLQIARANANVDDDGDGSMGGFSQEYAGVTLAFQGSYTGFDDGSPASCSSSVFYQSTFATDAYGNLTKFKAGGTGAGEFTMEDPGQGAYSTGATGASSATINFSTLGGPVPYTLDLNLNGNWNGDPNQGELGLVRLILRLYDGGEMQYAVNELIATPEDSLPASLPLFGTLSEGFHSLFIQVQASGFATFGQGVMPPQIGADANCTWDLTFTLAP